MDLRAIAEMFKGREPSELDAFRAELRKTLLSNANQEACRAATFCLFTMKGTADLSVLASELESS